MRTHGRYAITRKVADGGMAEIFLARQSGAEGFARSVIVKRILPAYSADPHFRNMLVDEAHIAMTLNHSNIVPVLDLGQSGGCYFMVLELVDGWDLATIRVRANKCGEKIPLGICLYVVAEICRALAYAHGRKDARGKPLQIVHRDVSPQNVLISEQGEVKVADFGIAKALGKRERTQTGVIKGKLEYMSPEQALGKPLDAASDVFAVGTLLYLLATGQRPFASPSDFEALLRVQRAEFVPPEKVCPDLSPAVARIVKRAMQARPADRHGSAEEMMIEVEAVLRGELGSPGQSELKRWLRELSERDGALPVSRRPGIAAPEAVSEGWLVEGDMLALEGPGVSGFGQTAVAPGTPLPRKVPSGSQPASPSSELSAAPESGPVPAPPSRRASKPSWPRNAAVMLGLLGMGWLAASQLLSTNKPRQLAAAARPAPAGAVGRTPAPAAAGAGERAARAAERGPRRPTDRVTLTLQTRPPGASVVGPSGALGTTPLPWTVRAGTTHTLTFAKSGFAPATRRISADSRSTTVLVELRPKPRPTRKRR
jgi:eukaryotic-like serine/threonine-protein kinase